MQMRRGDGLGQGQAQGEGVARLSRNGAAGMNGEGLHVSLDPPRALREPLGAGGRGRLPGGPLDDAEVIARSGEPKADVRVFGYIVRVPGANPPERGDLEVRYYVANTPTAKTPGLLLMPGLEKET